MILVSVLASVSICATSSAAEIAPLQTHENLLVDSCPNACVALTGVTLCDYSECKAFTDLSHFEECASSVKNNFPDPVPEAGRRKI